jgi:hypothetical protein
MAQRQSQRYCVTAPAEGIPRSSLAGDEPNPLRAHRLAGAEALLQHGRQRSGFVVQYPLG